MLATSASGGGLSIAAGSGPGDEPRQTVTLDDDETQSYVLALVPGAAPPGRARRSTWRFARSPRTWTAARR